MAQQLNPDLCVIGAGSAGLSMAAAAAAFGVPVVLVEKGRMGGECLNTGCVPSKAMIAAAKNAHSIDASGIFGIQTQRPTIAFDRVNDHIKDVIAAIQPNDSVERFTGLGVRVIAGQARFRDPRTVLVGPDEDLQYEIKARRFVIATGSSPAVPSIPGLEATPYLTNETVFDLRLRPPHLIVIGAGPVGLELAQAFRRLGSEVTVLEAAQPLAKEDPECAAIVLDALAREGVTIRSGARIERVRRERGRIEVLLAGDPAETIEGTDLLVATGRRSNVAGLNLDAARVKHGPAGIAVNRKFATSNKRVYAIGDVTGSLQFTHAANHQAGLLARHLFFRLPVKLNPALVPRVTFTDPELAQVGLTDEEARTRHGSIHVLRWPYHENDRAQAERLIEGHIKVVTDKRGRVLGATIVGASAGELITAWTLAVHQGLNIRAFAEIVVPYPTLAEIGKRAAITYFIPRLTSRWLRRLVGLLRNFR